MPSTFPSPLPAYAPASLRYDVFWSAIAATAVEMFTLRSANEAPLGVGSGVAVGVTVGEVEGDVVAVDVGVGVGVFVGSVVERYFVII